ncbi:unnamed protein product [Haemonchus placei]|uniref:C2H2-type domain-containing protein n=1 Tax=Haemonchus placei TaxID=6290 RepID=A0A0N4WXE1_HAEPC|nr:unnamed protein product [Haemonchus placei]
MGIKRVCFVGLCTLADDIAGLRDEAACKSLLKGDDGPRVNRPEDSQELQVDDTGCPICPLCGEKLVESEWSHHVEHEKKKLLGVIQSVKESKLMEPSSNAEQSRRKRELELLRIRNNQQKRLACLGELKHRINRLQPINGSLELVFKRLRNLGYCGASFLPEQKIDRNFKTLMRL